MIKSLIVVILVAMLLFTSCIKQPTGTSPLVPGITPSNETPLPVSSTPADVTFSYGRLFQYWTSDDHLTGDQTIRGLGSWQLNLVPIKAQQQRESRVIVSSPYSIPNGSYFQPEKVEMEGSLYSYTLPLKVNEFSKPEIIIVPPPSDTWSGSGPVWMLMRR